MVLFSSIISLLIFCLFDLSITEKGMLTFPIIIMGIYISLQLYQFCFIYFDVLGSKHVKYYYVFLENWMIYYYIMTSLFLVIFLVLKSGLSEINNNYPIFFLKSVLAWYVLSCCLFLTYLCLFNWSEFLVENIVGPCAFIHHNNLCHLIGVLRTFTFKVTIDIGKLIYAMFLTVFYILHLFFAPFLNLLFLPSLFLIEHFTWFHFSVSK